MKYYKRDRSYSWLFRRKDLRRRIVMVASIIFLLICLAKLTRAQDSTGRKTLSPESVIQIVKKFHPVARQADIQIEKAKADITIARGLFDPLFYNSSAQKKFDGANYYYYTRPELIIPTWMGIDITAGTEYLSGDRTDPQNTKGETSFIGISVPLAKNLLMDKRRAALQTAKIYREASDAEKRAIINDLLLDAITTYWNWVKQYQQYQIIRNAVLVNEKRLDLVRISFRQGDRPAIDTTEALAQLQNFQLQQTEAWMQFQNEGLNLSVFLWKENDAPFYLPPDAVPDPQSLFMNIERLLLPEPGQLQETALKNHPELIQYDLKLDALTIERKLKFQELLPSVNFRYNQLGKGYDIVKTANAPLFENNYQYGISIGLPLRFSQARGEYRKAKLKMQETQLQLNQKKLQIENKLKSAYNELVALKVQATIQENAWRNYLALQRGEETKLQVGESSLFLVNARENKTLEALQKLTELKVKCFQSLAKLNWSAGVLHLL
ncbi:MAG: TolC family protein [Chitinophagaceae bacterium]|nr:TolC family protein [Chitinophagaceae bacterium]